MAAIPPKRQQLPLCRALSSPWGQKEVYTYFAMTGIFCSSPPAPSKTFPGLGLGGARPLVPYPRPDNTPLVTSVLAAVLLGLTSPSPSGDLSMSLAPPCIVPSSLRPIC